MFRKQPVSGNALKERYYRCFIDNFKQNYQDPEAPVSFTYSMVFNGTEPLIKSEIDDLIAANTEVYDFGGNKWQLIGEQLLTNELLFDEIKINISDYLINLITTTPPSEVNTIVNMTFRLLNFSMSPAMQNKNSAEFQAIASKFCQYLDKSYKSRFQDYLSCDVQKFYTDFTDGSDHVNFYLTFRGDQDANLPKLLIAIIVENAHRETINTNIVLVVGPLNVFEDSLQQDHTNSMVVTGGGTTLATPSADPCAPDKNNVMLPDTRDKSAYFICYKGSGYPSTCGKDRVFDPVRSICTSP
ncbi:uncharacterized protein LOC132744304 isoform X2 [Ruditapes philippinarum]|uniref:uncharacterized protein LOC132744304 isoform X2 n=1 Tax=Ruditapes philippinarum TaxID=129788 RepID=UPI00295A62FB|nr:uncharacterized protein LOC132744304 isoform X2 [Ruditapes philippinarum]